MDNGFMSGPALGGVFTIIIGSVLFMLVFFILSLVIFWKIWSKAGFSGAMSLLMLIPIVNFIMLCVLAFGEWPIHREMEQLRAQLMMRGAPQPSFPPRYPPYPPAPQPPFPPQYPGY